MSQGTGPEMPPILAQGRHRHFSLVVLFALLQATSVAVAALATRRLFAHLHSGSSEQPWESLAMLLGSGLTLAVARVLGTRCAEALGQDYAAQLRIILYRHLSRMSARTVSRRRRGGMTLRFVGDLSAVRNWVSMGVTRLVVATALLPLGTCTLWWLHPALAAAVALPVLLGLLLVYAVGWWLGPAHANLRRMRARIAIDMSERVSSAAALHTLGRTSKELQRLRSRTASLREAAIRKAGFSALARSMPDACLGVASTCLLWTAVSQRIEPATVAASLAVLGLIIHPLRELAGVVDRYHAWRAARARCLALLGTPGLPQERVADVGEPPSRGATLQASRARVESSAELDLCLLPGEHVALVGPNGSGKTLLLQCMAGLDVLESGNIRIDGLTPMQHRSLASRPGMLLASYNPILAGSLRLALSMGMKKRPPDEVIIRVAESYGLRSCIERLGGLDGRVAEGGRNLSAGERARMLMARAALLKPRLLLIDAIDAHLDQSAPHLLRQLFEDTGATVLIVTHRPDVLAILHGQVEMRMALPCGSLERI
ncbi:MAG: ABC transporter ATP-binding protein [Lautropia sp.]|nr:ABC transporter ATP-binding protein [Lautropia sp.]